MPQFSERSLRRLRTCDSRLQRLFEEVILHWDCTVLEGHRTEEEQEEAVRTGHSHLGWPVSKHNAWPALAMDVAPYPIDWADMERFYAFSGFVGGIAVMMRISIRTGLDWDSDRDFHDQRLIDGPHFELVEEWPKDEPEVFA